MAYYTRRLGTSQSDYMWPLAARVSPEEAIRELLWRVEQLEKALGGGDTIDDKLRSDRNYLPGL
jgi:hypothetical protein